MAWEFLAGRENLDNAGNRGNFKFDLSRPEARIG